ncbi:MAG: hypothetical protein J7M32_07195 [Deltaproteobacteria bacterium]|nr:hypothetical protein [Deltaproteobacteria bacterium]OQX62994.1 MAG: hypothetical protein B5M55_07535 [Desulfococcus sp. 4484_242]
MVTAWAFSLVFPFLLTAVLLQAIAAAWGVNLKSRAPALMLVLIAACLVLVPVKGLPLGRWMISFNANFSIPLTAILFSRVVDRFFGIRVLDERAVSTCWFISLTAGIVLYPMALGLTRWDPYAAGWGFSWLFVIAFAVTVILLAVKNRFGIVLIAAILAYNLGFLESTNLWDYLVDPFLAVTACVGIGAKCRARSAE